MSIFFLIFDFLSSYVGEYGPLRWYAQASERFGSGPHSDKPTYRDLACHICQMSVGAISREIQAERNRPYRESRYPSLEISTNVAIFDARCLQTEELSHQPIDSHRMRRDG